MPSSEAPSKTYTCDVCGETFSTPQGLGGHTTKHTHSDKPATSAEVIQYARNAELNARAAELMIVAEASLADVDARIAEAVAVVDALKAERADIVQMMRRVSPTKHEAKRDGKGRTRPATSGELARHARQDEAKRELVLNAFRETREPVTGAEIVRMIRERGWTPLPSPAKVVELTKQLHDQGVIRAVHKVRGGGFAYALITSNGGSPDAT